MKCPTECSWREWLRESLFLLSGLGQHFLILSEASTRRGEEPRRARKQSLAEPCLRLPAAASGSFCFRSRGLAKSSLRVCPSRLEAAMGGWPMRAPCAGSMSYELPCLEMR